MRIEEFLKDFKISDSVLEHTNETTTEFLSYIKMLTSHKESSVNWFLYDYLLNEFISSEKIENGLYNEQLLSIYEKNLLKAKSLNIEDIKLVNKIVRSDSHILSETEFNLYAKKNGIDKSYKEYLNEIAINISGEYRKSIVWIGNPKEGIEYAFHVPPLPTEIEGYMNEFVDYFNKSTLNPFIMGALAHMIFIKIHPFYDGNGRTARLMMNQCVKLGFEKELEITFKYPMVNISSSLDLSRIDYFKKQNNIVFKPNVDNTEAINKWLNFILTMYDEQIYFLKNKIEKNDRVFYKMDNDLLFGKSK